MSTGKSCYANLKIVKTNGKSLNLKAPATLPNLNSILEVIVDDERYWKIVFKKDLNWKTLEYAFLLSMHFLNLFIYFQRYNIFKWYNRSETKSWLSELS